MDDPSTPLIGRFGHCSQVQNAVKTEELCQQLFLNSSFFQTSGAGESHADWRVHFETCYFLI